MLEGQRSTARLMLLEGVPALGQQCNRLCHSCGPSRLHSVSRSTISGDDSFLHSLAGRVLSGSSAWPPALSTMPLTDILPKLYFAGNIDFRGDGACIHNINMTVPNLSFQTLAQEVYEAAGVCLWCAKYVGQPKATCMHHRDAQFEGSVAYT